MVERSVVLPTSAAIPAVSVRFGWAALDVTPVAPAGTVTAGAASDAGVAEPPVG